MSSILEDIRRLFRNGANPGIQLIAVNGVIFLLFHILGVFDVIFSTNKLQHFFSQITFLPASLGEWIFKPWTVITYGFTHIGLGHIFWNMLSLYFAGNFIANFHPARRITVIYILGVLAGAALYYIGGFLNPSLTGNGLIGASAGVLALIVTCGLLAPDYEVPILRIKLKYVVLAYVLIATIIHFAGNTGGKFAHIGGALMGYLYMMRYRQGKDIGKWLDQLLQRLKGLFSGKPWQKKSPLRTVKSPKHNARNMDDETYRASKAAQQKKVDQILDKINKSGWSSLTREEKDFLANSGKD